MSRTLLDDRFVNELIAGEAASRRYPPRGWLLMWLVACCLAPRLWMAARLDTLCNDAVFYIQLADRLERGDLDGGLGELRLNIYPPLLAGLHSLGFEWQTAGEWWGVAMSSLTVLPLFGWLRRQFSERLAVVGCLLYAVHPKLVESSPELLRDPTFWFLWSLSLYGSWRAAAEMRLGWYLLAGWFIALSLHTRFEGWSLYLLLIGWTLCRQTARPAQAIRQSRRPRGALVATAYCAAAMAVCPLLLLAVNLTWLAGQPRWELGNFRRLEYVALWSHATWEALRGDVEKNRDLAPPRTSERASSRAADLAAAPPSPALSSSASASSAAPRRLGVAQTLWRFGNSLRRGFGALFGICWILGFGYCPRLWLRRDHLILFAIAGCVAAGAWIHLWYAQATSSRYFLSTVLLALPCAAMGCCRAYGWLERAANALLIKSPLTRGTLLLARSDGRSLALPAIILLTLTANVSEIMAGQHPGRQREAALGRWVLAEFGPGTTIATPAPTGLLGFYAQANILALTAEATAMEHADLAVMLPPVAKTPWAQRFSELARSRGLRPIDSPLLPAGFDWQGVTILARDKITKPRTVSLRPPNPES